jgi:hypothetical protein
MNQLRRNSAVAIILAIAMSSPLSAQEKVKVTVDNFVRAETAFQFDRMINMAGGTNKWEHLRVPTPLDKQSVIRMNRDTLYSFAVVDISKGATLTIPDSGKRYLSVMVVNEDEYINRIFHESGTYKLTMDEFDTPFVSLSARILADPNDPDDIKEANALQDKLRIESVGGKPYDHPDYDKESYEAIYKPLLELAAAGVADARKMFGKKDEVDEVRHLIGAAFGWGGLPTYEAVYETNNAPRPAGKYRLTVKDVPVDAFWSISIYNKDGYFEENKFDSYNINSVTAKYNDDGSVTVNFGTNKDGQDNFLYVMDGWNYTVRLYRPQQEVQDGKWKFPVPERVE